MKNILIAVVVLGLVALGAYYFKPTGAVPAALPTEASLRELLRNTTIDVSEFGGGAVTLVDGEVSFTTDPSSTSSPQGFVQLSDKQAFIFKGENAEVFAIANINGGGSGTFQFLLWLSYNGAEAKLIEKQRLGIGDRLAIDDVAANQTSATTFDILVSLKDRLPSEPMAATPTQPRVLHFAYTDSGLALRDVIFGTVADPQVVIASPLPGLHVPRSFTIAGAARGPWFFEANLPIDIKNATGTVLLTIPATAQGDWMTTELVPFSTLIEMPADAPAGLYTVSVRKDNPSGMPENDGSIEFPIILE